MMAEKKSDLSGALAEFEHALWLAIRQGVIRERFEHQAVLHVGAGDPYIVLVTVGRVAEEKKAA